MDGSGLSTAIFGSVDFLISEFGALLAIPVAIASVAALVSIFTRMAK